MELEVKDGEFKMFEEPTFQPPQKTSKVESCQVCFRGSDFNVSIDSSLICFGILKFFIQIYGVQIFLHKHKDNLVLTSTSMFEK